MSECRSGTECGQCVKVSVEGGWDWLDSDLFTFFIRRSLSAHTNVKRISRIWTWVFLFLILSCRNDMNSALNFVTEFWIKTTLIYKHTSMHLAFCNSDFPFFIPVIQEITKSSTSRNGHTVDLKKIYTTNNKRVRIVERWECVKKE